MKLRNVHIRDFRCIEDSTDFRIDDVTCLVGKNESGKTAVLAALEKLNPALTGRETFSRLDYPRKKWRPNEAIPNDPPVISTRWELSPEELTEISSMFGSGCVNSSEVRITKSYDNRIQVNPSLDENAIVQRIFDDVGISRDKLTEAAAPQTLLELTKYKFPESIPAEMSAAVTSTITKRFPSGLDGVRDHIATYMPKFLYFGEYNTLKGELALDQFLVRKTEKRPTWSDWLFEALLSLAGTKPEDVSKLGRFEDLNASLRAVSNQISAEIFAYWTQNKYLDFVLRFDQGRPEDPVPLNSGYIFRARIDNRRHRSDTNFDERSSGFVWFFSFLIWFSQLKARYGKRLIILLDEPGLTLHARAQADLLRYINERLKPNYQVIYTTHSPFMVDPGNILSARTVEDVELKGGELLGTRIGDKVLSTDVDTISPLQRALDYEMTQTLFVGRHTLLVEGESDLVYLKWASNALRESSKGAPLDYRWTICIVGGIDRIPSFASLFRGNGLFIVALVDYATGQKQKIANARKAIGDKHVVTADQYSSQTEADIEDVLGREFYVEVVNRAYALVGPDKLSVPTMKEAPRIVKFVEDRFKLLPERYGDFSHFRPAEWLTTDGNDVATLLGRDIALANFKKLIADINGTLAQ